MARRNIVRRRLWSIGSGLGETNRSIALLLTLGGFPLPIVMVTASVLTLLWLLAVTADFVLMAEYFNTLFTTPYAGELRASMVVVLAIAAGYLIETATGIAPSPFLAIRSARVRVVLWIVGVCMMLFSLGIAGVISSQVYSALGPQVCASEASVVQPEFTNSVLVRERCVERWDSNDLARWTQVGLAEMAVLGTAFFFFAPITVLSLLCLVLLRLAEAVLLVFGGDSSPANSARKE